MRGSARISLPARERGAALLILLALIIPILIFAVVAGLNRSAGELARAREQKTYAALAQAKEALIAYAVTYMDDPTHTNRIPGYLPCPDLGTSAYEGQTALSCPQSGPTSLVSVMGRLPWRTLGLEALKDGSGECLWYAVSGTYKNDPNGNAVSGSATTSNMMNWDTNGQFAVKDADGVTFLTGSTADTNAVAVIFAPGSALKPAGATAIQDRAAYGAATTACGGNYTATNYLEGFDANKNNVIDSNEFNNSHPLNTGVNQPDTFVAGAASDTFNDQLVYITRADIWNAIKRRSDFYNYLRALTRRAAECTAMYGANNNNPNNKRLPWPSNVSLSTTSVPRYAVDARYNDALGVMSGRLSFRVDTSRSPTNNGLLTSTVSGTTDYYLPTSGVLTSGVLTSGSYCLYTSDQQVWYDNWKDQLFYAIANSFKPSGGSATSCGTCLTINGGGSYAAVVIFAGDKRTNAAGQIAQPRNIATDKGTIANYLEGLNLARFLAPTGGDDYQAAATSSSFNDIVYAIDNDLNVYCSDAGGVMRPLTLGVPPPSPPGDPKAYAACP